MHEPPRHPGELLAVTLAAAGMSQADLSRRTGISTKHINQIHQGVAGISARSAVLLEEATGVDAGLWLRMQTVHDLAVARERRRDERAAEQTRTAATKKAAREAAESFTDTLGATDGD